MIFLLHKNINGYYYHFLSVFDTNMNLIKYTDLFNFENKKVEYCIGFIIEKERFIFSYSILDTSCYIATFSSSYIFNNLKWH